MFCYKKLRNNSVKCAFLVCCFVVHVRTKCVGKVWLKKDAPPRIQKNIVVFFGRAYKCFNQLPHVCGPKIIILNSNKTTACCGSKGGSG